MYRWINAYLCCWWCGARKGCCTTPADCTRREAEYGKALAAIGETPDDGWADEAPF